MRCPAIRAFVLAGGLLIATSQLSTASIAKTAHAPPFSVWDVELGGLVTEIPERDLAEIACGTNGGPPSRPLASLDEFGQCPPADDGVREIYFSYDDELEYRARAMELETESALYAGTTVAGHPVVASVLAADDGKIVGIRIITDDRADIRERRRAASLSTTLKSRFGADWTCTDTPPEEGEIPLGGIFINQYCEKSDETHGRLSLATRYLRKKGQHGRDPITGRAVKGAYESLTRFEQRKP
jgi:hypothetical protein